MARVLTLTGQGTGTVNSNVLLTKGSTLLTSILSVTAASGTPTLDVELQWSSDGVVWASATTPDAFTQATGTTNEAIDQVTVKGMYVRAQAVVGGTTPSFDATVDIDPIN